MWVRDDSAGSLKPEGQLTLNEPQLTAPLKKGQVVGTHRFQLNGKSIEQRPLMVMENVEEGGIFSADVGFCADETPSVVCSWFS